jgi:solute carrier family 9B (sodium/hydrogen exchanger), member 1/2
MADQGGEIMTHHTHDEVIAQKHLPRVGQIVRSRKHGTLWRIMEKREVWQNTPNDLQAEQPHLVPAIYLIFWKIQEGATPGIGIMRGHTYTLYDNTFEANWEMVEST